MELQKMYNDVFSFLNNYKNDIAFDFESLKSTANEHLFYNRLKTDYGFNLDEKASIKVEFVPEYVELKSGVYYLKNCEYTEIDLENIDNKAKIEKGEELIKVSAEECIFTEIWYDKVYTTYRVILRSFFKFLKEYNPKYIDTRNKVLYFDLKNGSKVFNEYDNFIEEWREKVKDARFNLIKKVIKHDAYTHEL